LEFKNKIINLDNLYNSGFHKQPCET